MSKKENPITKGQLIAQMLSDRLRNNIKDYYKTISIVVTEIEKVFAPGIADARLYEIPILKGNPLFIIEAFSRDGELTLVDMNAVSERRFGDAYIPLAGTYERDGGSGPICEMYLTLDSPHRDSFTLEQVLLTPEDIDIFKKLGVMRTYKPVNKSRGGLSS